MANVQNGATLEISFIGYLNQDVKVNGTKPVSIILKEDTKMLDEVVVVGLVLGNLVVFFGHPLLSIYSSSRVMARMSLSSTVM